MPYAALKGRSFTVAHAQVVLTCIFSRPVYAIDRSSLAPPGLCSHFVSRHPRLQSFAATRLYFCTLCARYATAAFALATRPRSPQSLGGVHDLQSYFLQCFFFALDSALDGVD